MSKPRNAKHLKPPGHKVGQILPHRLGKEATPPTRRASGLRKHETIQFCVGLSYDNPSKPTQGPSMPRGKPCLETGRLAGAHSPFPQPLAPVPEPSGNESSGDLRKGPFLFSVEHYNFSLEKGKALLQYKSTKHSLRLSSFPEIIRKHMCLSFQT